MFLRYNTRHKDGKEHRYWSVVENRRLRTGHATQRTVLYLGEVNDTQQAAWRKSLEVINETNQATEQVCLYPEDREIPPEVLNGLRIKLSELTLQRPRVFGDCWLGCRLWDELQLETFWRSRLPDGKAEVPWFKVLELLTVRQLVAPGSKWHLHRRWFLSSAMDQLLEEDFAVAAKNRLRDSVEVKLLSQGREAKRTPAGGMAVADPYSGVASSSNPKRASSRSARRWLGSVSWLAAELSLAVEEKADRFGFAPCSMIDSDDGAAADAKPDSFGCAISSTPKGNSL